jgi:phage gp45-like
MKKCLLAVALALVTVWATGCIIVDADKMEVRQPTSIQSQECQVQQGLADTPTLESQGNVSATIVE